jgi:uncharacterized coiled-coil protein SlyX
MPADLRPPADADVAGAFMDRVNEELSAQARAIDELRAQLSAQARAIDELRAQRERLLHALLTLLDAARCNADAVPLTLFASSSDPHVAAWDADLFLSMDPPEDSFPGACMSAGLRQDASGASELYFKPRRGAFASVRLDAQGAPVEPGGCTEALRARLTETRDWFCAARLRPDNNTPDEW